MTDPDFQKLAAESIWGVNTWLDAWYELRASEPNDTRREAFWECILQLSPFVKPTNAVSALIEVAR